MMKIGMIMDPIAGIEFKKDTTMAMLFEVKRRGWDMLYMEQSDLFYKHGKAYAKMTELDVHDDESHWFDFGNSHVRELNDCDVIFMRKDPPFNQEYIYSTYLLELAEKEGTLVVNKPQGLRDANEKMYTTWFPQCTPPTLVASKPEQIHQFIAEHGDVILKPLHIMGGASVFHLKENDDNTNVVIETLSKNGTELLMAQKFIPDIYEKGDKRIFVINGKGYPYALARIPKKGEFRGNLAVGGTGVGVELTEKEKWICEQVGPTLKEKGLWFVGIDVIGEYLTEINVTSPTCVRQVDKHFNVNVIGELMDFVEASIP